MFWVACSPSLEKNSRFAVTPPRSALGVSVASAAVSRSGTHRRHRLPKSNVKVTVEIEAQIPDGVAEDTQRVVNENCQTLKFKSHGFERS